MMCLRFCPTCRDSSRLLAATTVRHPKSRAKAPAKRGLRRLRPRPAAPRRRRTNRTASRPEANTSASEVVASRSATAPAASTNATPAPIGTEERLATPASTGTAERPVSRSVTRGPRGTEALPATLASTFGTEELPATPAPTFDTAERPVIRAHYDTAERRVIRRGIRARAVPTRSSRILRSGSERTVPRRNTHSKGETRTVCRSTRCRPMCGWQPG